MLVEYDVVQIDWRWTPGHPPRVICISCRPLENDPYCFPPVLGYIHGIGRKLRALRPCDRAIPRCSPHIDQFDDLIRACFDHMNGQVSVMDREGRSPVWKFVPNACNEPKSAPLRNMHDLFNPSAEQIASVSIARIRRDQGHSARRRSIAHAWRLASSRYDGGVVLILVAGIE